MSDDQTQTIPTETPTESQIPVVENPTPQETPVSITLDIPNSPDLPKPEENLQSVPAEQTPPKEQQNIPEAKSQIEVPTLYFPFYGTITPSLSFNQIPDHERIKQKFKDWGIVGHNGLDFPLSEGTEVLACDAGKVTQSGDNGEYGNSVVIQHSWGQSTYAHLKETKVSSDQEIKAGELIGLSGQTGSALGPHLHFAISPSNPDPNNGYLGFIDPSPYLKNVTQKPETPMTEQPKPPEEKPKEESVPISQPRPEPVPDVSINIEPVIPPSQPLQPPIPPEPVINDAEIQKQVDEKLAQEVETLRLKANEVRKANREEHLVAIEKLVSEKKEITSQDVQNLVHVSRTTAFDYLTTLINSGRIKVEGKGKATVYKNIFS